MAEPVCVITLVTDHRLGPRQGIKHQSRALAIERTKHPEFKERTIWDVFQDERDNVERRLAQLQTESPVKLLLIEYRAVSLAEVLSIESRIHKTLAGYRMKEEWFSCDLATAKSAVESVVPV